MVTMVTNAPRLQGLLILPNEHCTYKYVLVMASFNNNQIKSNQIKIVYYSDQYAYTQLK